MHYLHNLCVSEISLPLTVNLKTNGMACVCVIDCMIAWFSFHSLIPPVSLGEFGKHVPAPPKQPHHSVGKTTDTPPSTDLPSTQQQSAPGMEEFEEIFSEELAMQAEAQLDEAMRMMASENPELWQQFETFAKSMGLDNPPPPTTSEGRGEGEASQADPSSIEAKLEETLKALRESTEQIEVRAHRLYGYCKDIDRAVGT